MPELLEVVDLKKYFPVGSKIAFRRAQFTVRAVDGVSFTLSSNETLAVVGESGCGKSTLARCILRLIEPTEGTVRFQGVDVATARRERLRREMAVVFQDPFASLDPRRTAGYTIGEPLLVHKVAARRERRASVEEMLELVGLTQDDYDKYPRDFSGGQRQRIGLARALILRPKLVICDEPISALDVSVQAQVLNLFKRLQQELGLSYIFITHDLRVVNHVADRVAVMYLGRIVEDGPVDAIFVQPKHPYTKALLDAIPEPHPRAARSRQRTPVGGEAPTVREQLPGCPFHPRCPRAHPGMCDVRVPAYEARESTHRWACFFPLDNK